MWPISIHPCQYVKLQNAQKKLCFRQQLDACRQKAPLRSCAFVLRLSYCIYKAYQVKYSSCSCDHSGSYLSLCMHKLTHKQCWHNPIIHPVLTSSTVGCIFSLQDDLFYSFRYSLISIHSVEKNSTITVVVVIANTLRLDAPMFYHLWCQTVTAQSDWCASHLVRGKHSWSVTPRSAWSAIPPYAAACEMTCKYISYPYPLTTFVYNGCFSKLCHDGCDGKKSVREQSCIN